MESSPSARKAERESSTDRDIKMIDGGVILSIAGNGEGNKKKSKKKKNKNSRLESIKMHDYSADLHCNLCNITFTNEKTSRWHMMSDGHHRNVAKRRGANQQEKSVSSVRPIQEQVSPPPWLQEKQVNVCKVCRSNVRNMQRHCGTKTHTTNMTLVCAALGLEYVRSRYPAESQLLPAAGYSYEVFEDEIMKHRSSLHLPKILPADVKRAFVQYILEIADFFQWHCPVCSVGDGSNEITRLNNWIWHNLGNRHTQMVMKLLQEMGDKYVEMYMHVPGPNLDYLTEDEILQVPVKIAPGMQRLPRQGEAVPLIPTTPRCELCRGKVFKEEDHLKSAEHKAALVEYMTLLGKTFEYGHPLKQGLVPEELEVELWMYVAIRQEFLSKENLLPSHPLLREKEYFRKVLEMGFPYWMCTVCDVSLDAGNEGKHWQEWTNHMLSRDHAKACLDILVKKGKELYEKSVRLPPYFRHLTGTALELLPKSPYLQELQDLSLNQTETLQTNAEGTEKGSENICELCKAPIESKLHELEDYHNSAVVEYLSLIGREARYGDSRQPLTIPYTMRVDTWKSVAKRRAELMRHQKLDVAHNDLEKEYFQNVLEAIAPSCVVCDMDLSQTTRLFTAWTSHMLSAYHAKMCESRLEQLGKELYAEAYGHLPPPYYIHLQDVSVFPESPYLNAIDMSSNPNAPVVVKKEPVPVKVSFEVKKKSSKSKKTVAEILGESDEEEDKDKSSTEKEKDDTGKSERRTSRRSSKSRKSEDELIFCKLCLIEAPPKGHRNAKSHLALLADYLVLLGKNYTSGDTWASKLLPTLPEAERKLNAFVKAEKVQLSGVLNCYDRGRSVSVKSAYLLNCAVWNDYYCHVCEENLKSHQTFGGACNWVKHMVKKEHAMTFASMLKTCGFQEFEKKYPNIPGMLVYYKPQVRKRLNDVSFLRSIPDKFWFGKQEFKPHASRSQALALPTIQPASACPEALAPPTVQPVTAPPQALPPPTVQPASAPPQALAPPTIQPASASHSLWLPINPTASSLAMPGSSRFPHSIDPMLQKLGLSHQTMDAIMQQLIVPPSVATLGSLPTASVAPPSVLPPGSVASPAFHPSMAATGLLSTQSLMLNAGAPQGLVPASTTQQTLVSSATTPQGLGVGATAPHSFGLGASTLHGSVPGVATPQGLLPGAMTQPGPAPGSQASHLGSLPASMGLIPGTVATSQAMYSGSQMSQSLQIQLGMASLSASGIAGANTMASSSAATPMSSLKPLAPMYPTSTGVSGMLSGAQPAPSKGSQLAQLLCKVLGEVKTKQKAPVTAIPPPVVLSAPPPPPWATDKQNESSSNLYDPFATQINEDVVGSLKTDGDKDSKSSHVSPGQRSDSKQQGRRRDRSRRNTSDDRSRRKGAAVEKKGGRKKRRSPSPETRDSKDSGRRDRSRKDTSDDRSQRKGAAVEKQGERKKRRSPSPETRDSKDSGRRDGSRKDTSDDRSQRKGAAVEKQGEKKKRHSPSPETRDARDSGRRDRGRRDTSDDRSPRRGAAVEKQGEKKRTRSPFLETREVRDSSRRDRGRRDTSNDRSPRRGAAVEKQGERKRTRSPSPEMQDSRVQSRWDSFDDRSPRRGEAVPLESNFLRSLQGERKRKYSHSPEMQHSRDRSQRGYSRDRSRRECSDDRSPRRVEAVPLESNFLRSLQGERKRKHSPSPEMRHCQRDYSDRSPPERKHSVENDRPDRKRLPSPYVRRLRESSSDRHSPQRKRFNVPIQGSPVSSESMWGSDHEHGRHFDGRRGDSPDRVRRYSPVEDQRSSHVGEQASSSYNSRMQGNYRRGFSPSRTDAQDHRRRNSDEFQGSQGRQHNLDPHNDLNYERRREHHYEQDSMDQRFEQDHYQKNSIDQRFEQDRYQKDSRDKRFEQDHYQRDSMDKRFEQDHYQKDSRDKRFEQDHYQKDSMDKRFEQDHYQKDSRDKRFEQDHYQKDSMDKRFEQDHYQKDSMDKRFEQDHYQKDSMDQRFEQDHYQKDSMDKRFEQDHYQKDSMEQRFEQDHYQKNSMDKRFEQDHYQKDSMDKRFEQDRYQRRPEQGYRDPPEIDSQRPPWYRDGHPDPRWADDGNRRGPAEHSAPDNEDALRMLQTLNPGEVELMQDSEFREYLVRVRELATMMQEPDRHQGLLQALCQEVYRSKFYNSSTVGAILSRLGIA